MTCQDAVRYPPLMIRRSLDSPLIRDLEEKIVLLSGPRQCGKTTLSKALFKKFDCLNYDSPADREILSSQTWNRNTDLLIFDELHKMRQWKSWIKGLFDTEGARPRLLVTGSARLNYLRKAGDSLAGRHFNYRLHPLDLKELSLSTEKEREEALSAILNVGGFPEPFLKGSRKYYNRWSASHLDVILRQDLLDTDPVRDLKGIEILISLLAQKVGSRVSLAALARQLKRDPKTVAKWISLLENLYVIFKIPPYHKNIARAILKESKYYFYDTGRVEGENAIRWENAVACALLKETQRLFDTEGVKGGLYFIQTKSGREIDFFVPIEGTGSWLIEAKWRDADFSPNFKYFTPHFKNTRCVQLVRLASRIRTNREGWQSVKASQWLSQFRLTDF